MLLAHKYELKIYLPIPFVPRYCYFFYSKWLSAYI